jgi:TIGR03009 family protein
MVLLLCVFCCATLSAQPPTYQTNQNAVTGAPGGASPGQGVAAQPTSLSPEQQKRVEEILGAWEKEGKALESLVVRFKVTKENVVFKQQTFSIGEAKVMKMPVGTYAIRLEIYAMGRDGKPDYTKLERKYIFSGVWFYDYDPSNKTIFSRTVQQSLKPDDGPFAFIFGLTAQDAKKRFSLNIDKADKDWTWLRIVSLTAQDQKDFVVAILGLVNYQNKLGPKDFPLIIKWKEPNNNTNQWEITESIRNDRTKVSPLDFTIEEDKKAGWKVQLVPAQGSAVQPPRGPNGVTQAGAYTPPRK